MLGLAVSSLTSGRNTGALGTLSAVTSRSYGDCSGSVTFEALGGQQVSANVTVPCELPFGAIPGMAIDLWYYRGDPQNVAFAGAYGDGCDETGYDSARQMLLASVILLSVWFVVTMVMLLLVGLYVWNPNATASISEETKLELSQLKAGAV